MAQKATLAIASGTLALLLGRVSVGARPAPPPPLLDPVAAIVEAFDTHDLVALGDETSAESAPQADADPRLPFEA